MKLFISDHNGRVDPITVIASAIASQLPEMGPDTTSKVAVALKQLLEGEGEDSSDFRFVMGLYLLLAEKKRVPKDDKSSDLLTTEGAAELMKCSRPYVAMLIDNKKLPGSFVTEGGHRRVPRSSVMAWMESRLDAAKTSDYRMAAMETGMYAISDSEFANATEARSDE